MDTIELSSFIKRAFHLQMNFIESIVKGVFANIKKLYLAFKSVKWFCNNIVPFCASPFK